MSSQANSVWKSLKKSHFATNLESLESVMQCKEVEIKMKMWTFLVFFAIFQAENLNPKTVRLVVKLKLKTTGFLRVVGSLFQESRFAVERRRILKETAS